MAKTELDRAVERLDLRIETLDMQINRKPSVWPTRKSWRAMKELAQKVVDEYYREKEDEVRSNDNSN